MNPISTPFAPRRPQSLAQAHSHALSGLLLIAGLALSSVAQAHSPVCRCNAEGAEIVCQGGFSDGSSASGVTLEVISHDEEVLFSGTLDGESKIRFARPDKDFYVLMDAGPGHTVELDFTDIEGAAQPAKTASLR